MEEYLKMPWNIENTIENLKEIKEHLQNCVILMDMDGEGKNDAKEVAFDFDRAIAALEKQIPKKPVKTETEGYRFTDTYKCPACARDFSGTGIARYCYHCGQALDWSEDGLRI